MENREPSKNRKRIKKVFFFALLLVIVSVFVFVTKEKKEKRNSKHEQTSLTYDFSFAELAIRYLETGYSDYLQEISNLDAATHLYNHALNTRRIKPTSSKLELVTNLLSPIDKQRELLPIFKERLNFAKEDLVKSGIAEKIALQFLPVDFNFSGSLFFTFAYGHSAYGKTCNLNLADTNSMKNMNSMIHLAVHELHHVGFIVLKGGYMPHPDKSTYKEMLHEIEYLTHFEGMALYAQQHAFVILEPENAMEIDMPLRELQEFEKKYLDIYYHFKNKPDNLLTQEDWYKFHILDDKSLWYIVGSQMAKTIDKNLGREKLVSLISEPSENFIETYLELSKQ